MLLSIYDRKQAGWFLFSAKLVPFSGNNISELDVSLTVLYFTHITIGMPTTDLLGVSLPQKAKTNKVRRSFFFFGCVCVCVLNCGGASMTKNITRNADGIFHFRSNRKCRLIQVMHTGLSERKYSRRRCKDEKFWISVNPPRITICWRHFQK